MVRAGLLGLLVALPLSLAQDADALIGTVGTGCEYDITLTDDSGYPVSELPAGTYTIHVRDRCEEHNFHLLGPGLSYGQFQTGITAVEEQTWTVTLVPGAYTYLCDPHAEMMRGSFRVTA